MRKISLFFLFVFHFAASAFAQLSTTLPSVIFCPDTIIQVQYSHPGAIYQPGNVFTMQLSDATGSFAAPVTIGTVNATSSSGSIGILIPGTTPTGAGYRIRTTASSPAVTGPDNGTDLTIGAQPVFSVSPPYPVICQSLNQPLSLTASGNAVSYSWFAPNSALLSTGPTLNNTPLVNITVVATGTNGCKNSRTVNVDLNYNEHMLLREKFGEVAVPTTVANHFANSGFTSPGSIQFSGTALVVPEVLPSLPQWTTPPSGANVLFENPGETFEISGINNSGHYGIELTFLLHRNLVASSGTELLVEYSTDGVTYYPWPMPTLQANYCPVGFNWCAQASFLNSSSFNSATSPGPFSSNLRIRFTQTSSTVDFRIDNLNIKSNGGEPYIEGGWEQYICQGNPLTLATQGGQSYSWSNGATSPSINIVQPGFYRVTTTDIDGCPKISDQIQVFQVTTLPTIFANNNGPICEGTSIQLSATSISGATYSWAGPNGFTSAQQNPVLPAASTSATGVYSVFVTTPNCGSGSAATYAEVNPVPTVPVITGPSSVCIGGVLNLSAASTTGATYDWTFNWYSLGSQQHLSLPITSNYNEGDYSVTATLAGCTSAPATQTIAVTPGISTPLANVDSPLCFGQPIQFSATGVPGVTYSWVGPNGFISAIPDPVITNPTAADYGMYTVYTELNGCTSQRQVYAYAMVVGGGSLNFCPGEDIYLNAYGPTGTTFSWSGPNGFTAVGPDHIIPNATAANSGAYTITGQHPLCPMPPAIVYHQVFPQVNLTYPSSTYCASDDTFVLPTPIPDTTSWGIFTATPAGLNLNSYSGEFNPSYSQPGNYTIIFNNYYLSCVDPDTFLITITSNPLASFSYAQSSYCQSSVNPVPVYPAGASGGVFSATPAGLVIANAATGEIDLSASQPGTYAVTNTIAASPACAGAIHTETISIGAAMAAPLISANTPVCEGQPLQLSAMVPGPATYSWLGPGGFVSSNQNPVISLTTAALAGNYSVWATTNGCTALPALVAVSVTPLPVLSYADSAFCTSGLAAPTVIGTAGGTFSASATGLVIDVSTGVGSSRVDLQACKLEYSIVSPK